MLAPPFCYIFMQLLPLLLIFIFIHGFSPPFRDLEVLTIVNDKIIRIHLGTNITLTKL
jgi:hypothetical protein